MAEKQGTNLTFSHSGNPAKSTYWTANQIKSDRLFSCIENVSDLTNAERLCSPVVNVLDSDEAGVERKENTRRPCGENGRHGLTIHRNGGRNSNWLEFATNVSCYNLTVTTAYVPIRQCVICTSLANQT